jgi:hypothetical protein
MRWRLIAALVGMVPAAALLAACAGGPGLGSVASYGQSNMMSPAGYAEKQVDDTHYQVTATGTEATPKDRVEKIARARAAQIAVEQRMKYYKVASVQYGIACTKGHDFYKGGSTPAGSRPTVLIDVVYAKEPTDPTFVSAAESYEALSGELANEVVPPEAQAAAEQETRAGCGQKA